MTDPWFETDKCLIAGRWIAAESGRTLALENPSDGREIARIAAGGAPDIDAAVGAARTALRGDWGQTSGGRPRAGSDAIGAAGRRKR